MLPGSLSPARHDQRLLAFNCGRFQCKPGFFIEGDTDTAYIRSPVPAYLIEHPKGRALFDTGPGHQSAHVKLPSGDLLPAADCCYIQSNLDEMKLPGFTFDKMAGLATLERLTTLRTQGTRIYFGHDAQLWKPVCEGKSIS